MFALLGHEKSWRLRRAITEKGKALRYARQNPGGLNRLMVEHLEHDLQKLRAELARRKEQE